MDYTNTNGVYLWVLDNPLSVSADDSPIKLLSSPKCAPFALFNYIYLSSIFNILLLLWHLQQLIYHSNKQNFNFHDFEGLENEIFKFHDFQGFPMTCTNPVIINKKLCKGY